MKNVRNEWFCNGCGEFIDSGNVRYTDDGVQLCEVCYEECRAAGEGAQKNIEQQAQPKITPGNTVECSNRECDWRREGICTHRDGKCENHYILNPA